MRRVVLLTLVFTLGAAALGPVRAEDKAKKEAPSRWASLRTWFKHWKQALEKSAVEGRYRKKRSTAVAAVRGSAQDEKDPKKPYWKGTWSSKKRAERMKEREELAKAVELILKEKPVEAKAKLDAFEKAHPKSSFLPDVKEARAKLAELQASAGASAAPETPAAPSEEAAVPPKEEKAPAAPAEGKAGQ